MLLLWSHLALACDGLHLTGSVADVVAQIDGRTAAEVTVEGPAIRRVTLDLCLRESVAEGGMLFGLGMGAGLLGYCPAVRGAEKLPCRGTLTIRPPSGQEQHSFREPDPLDFRVTRMELDGWNGATIEVARREGPVRPPVSAPAAPPE